MKKHTWKIEIYQQEQFKKSWSTEKWVHCGISLYQRPLYQKQQKTINFWHDMDNDTENDYKNAL